MGLTSGLMGNASKVEVEGVMQDTARQFSRGEHLRGAGGPG